MKSIIPKSIVPMLIFAVVLNILRIIIWGKLSFIYILWNIFLAMIPFGISFLLFKYKERASGMKIIFIIGCFVWLLFIPNSHYVITDLIHLGEVKHAPLLYDTFMLFSSALVGLLFGLYSLSHMEQIIKTKFSKNIASAVMFIIFLLIGFGIYIGRFMRFNSWDFFSNHISLWSSFKDIFSTSADCLNVLGYTLLFSSFIYISYLSWIYVNPKNL